MSKLSSATLSVIWLLVCGSACFAQQAAPRPTAPKKPATPAVAPADDIVRKNAILASPQWRRAMFEMNEWFNAQKMYTPAQVAKTKADFAATVQRASAADLQLILDDINSKLKILETPEAQDARAWLAHYLSILSKQKREEVLKKLPKIGTMTAPQLAQEVAAIEERRAATEQQQQQVRNMRNSATDPWTQGDKRLQQAYIADHSVSAGGGYSSPYRPPSNKRPFEGVHTGAPDMGYMVGPFGGVSMMFGSGF
jgi:hypothetical protein